jgi:O-antigen/teichoic acid export membrane protein
LLLCRTVFEFWIGDKLIIPFELSVAIAIYLMILSIEAPLSSFINGIGKLRVMMILSVVQLVMFVPLAYVLGVNFGAVGIVSAMISVQLPPLYFQFRQVHLILNRKESGIWLR